MKPYTKKWLTAFSLSLLILVCLIAAFYAVVYDKNTVPYEPSPQTQPEAEPPDFDNYMSIEDNVGYVSFTEEQVTELARNMFSLDNYLNNITVELENKDMITVGAKIKDADKLVEVYPELKGYALLLSAIENKNLTLVGGLNNTDGMAGFEITNVTVGNMPVDEGLLSPFIEEDSFSEIFNVEYDSIDVIDGRLVFKDGLPDILQY